MSALFVNSPMAVEHTRAETNAGGKEARNVMGSDCFPFLTTMTHPRDAKKIRLPIGAPIKYPNMLPTTTAITMYSMLCNVIHADAADAIPPATVLHVRARRANSMTMSPGLRLSESM